MITQERKEQQKAYRLNNKNSKAKYDKQYRLNNKEYISKCKSKYYLDNKEHIKQYRLDNKEHFTEYKKEYYLKNKEYFIKYSLDNKEHKKQIMKAYHLKNKEKIKQYRLNNKEHKKQYQLNWEKDQMKNNPIFKIKKILRARLNLALKGKNKSASTMELLGCSIDKLWNHLESKFEPWMTRKNHGLWHIDHIKPCASFDLTCPVQQLACFHYTNLQPLSATDNLSKGAR